MPLQFAARAGRFQISDAILDGSHVLVAVAADDVSHAVFLDQLMKRKLAALKFHRDQPEGLVEEDELGIAIAVLRQVPGQKLHLSNRLRSVLKSEAWLLSSTVKCAF